MGVLPFPQCSEQHFLPCKIFEHLIYKMHNEPVCAGQPREPCWRGTPGDGSPFPRLSLAGGGGRLTPRSQVHTCGSTDPLQQQKYGDKDVQLPTAFSSLLLTQLFREGESISNQPYGMEFYLPW